MCKRCIRWTGVAGATLGLLALTTAAYCQDATTMAPPLDEPSVAQPAAGADNVFNWQEVPQNQEVPITRAVFDEGGYQLYDTAGETIVVPFTNHNLYVMKFGQSSSGGMYFVNTGNTPVLYVQPGGYLTNATVSGARWYPFSQDYHPSHPVFVGIAPSWSLFIGMGWYPGMVCWGGYWCSGPWFPGVVCSPMVGLVFVIGGHHFWGWGGYHDYFIGHPGFYHVGYWHRSVYRLAGRPNFGRAAYFHGAGRAFGGRSFGGNHGFAGGGRAFGGHSFAGGGRTLGGARSFGGGGHTFVGARSSFGGRPFNGGSFGGGHSAYAHRSFGGGGGSFGGGARSFGGGGHTFSGARSSGGGHSFSGGGHGGGGRSFGGGGHGGGGGGHRR